MFKVLFLLQFFNNVTVSTTTIKNKLKKPLIRSETYFYRIQNLRKDYLPNIQQNSRHKSQKIYTYIIIPLSTQRPYKNVK